MQSFKKQVLELMVQNRRVTNGVQYTLPSPDSYPYQWLWDSCFHAIILSHLEPKDAKKELLSLITKQFENGMIPHMIYWQKDGNHKKDFDLIDWGKRQTSSLTQPPMLSFAVWKVYQKDRDLSFLKEIYPKMSNYYRYLLTYRDPRGFHLIGIINPDESGEDNSPRFDIALGLSPRQTIEENFQKRLALIDKNKECKFDAPFCMKNFFWVKDVPFNTIMVENLMKLSEISLILGLESDADFFFTQAQIIKKAMRKLMLEDNIFWSTYGPDYKKIKIKTWAIFAPLFAKVATDEEAETVVSYLLNPDEFKVPFLVPTVSKSEASFDPKGFWRGPVWMATNWFIFWGLRKYGYLREAQKILESSIDLISKSGFREQFNPITGEGMGAHNFTWGGLVIDMMEDMHDRLNDGTSLFKEALAF